MLDTDGCVTYIDIQNFWEAGSVSVIRFKTEKNAIQLGPLEKAVLDKWMRLTED
jgi:hypothetical protein